MPTPSLQHHLSVPLVDGLIGKNISVGQRRTSIRLEASMWEALDDICRRERAPRSLIAQAVDRRRPRSLNLTAAIRVFILAYFRAAVTPQGHVQARHNKIASISELADVCFGLTRIGAPAPDEMNRCHLRGL